MLTETYNNATGRQTTTCGACGEAAKITMHCYGEGTIDLCTDHALQLARKLIEDVCEVATKGGRRG